MQYDDDNPPALEAARYRKGDRVLGVDGDDRLFGVVVAYPLSGDVDVLVRWDSEEYDETSRGHQVPAECLRLWPARLHRSRLLQTAVGRALDAVSPVARNEGETDEVYRIRAVQVWYAMSFEGAS